MRIILASSNKDKIKEIREIYNNFQVLCFDELIPSFEIEENGNSFKENALIKSKCVFNTLKTQNLLHKTDIVISDDSGICVDLLNGAPGIYSARYSGGNSKDNLEKLINKVKRFESQTSKAHYCACIAISSFFGDFSTHGFMHGFVIAEKRGENGFGYDPIFIPNGFNKTLAELSAQEKNQISHRYKALKLAKYIIESMGN